MSLEVSFSVVLSLLVAIQLLYHWRYFFKIKSDSKVSRSIINEVSVIVAARNESHNLTALLTGILSQDYPIFELIVVNDRSTDGSHEILQKWAKQDPRVKLVNIEELPEGWNGKKYALKKGIEAAQNEIILLTDADCVPTSNQWIKEMALRFSNDTDFVLGVSPYTKSNGFLNQMIQYETLLTAIQYISFALKGKAYMGVGRNLAYRKSMFLKNEFKGIEGLTGGDDDLFVNAHATSTNTRVCIDPRTHMLSIPKTSWSEYFTQKIRHLSIGKSYRKKDQTRLGLFAFSSLFGWIVLILAVLINVELSSILVIFGIRCLSIYIIFTKSGRKLNMKLAFWALPIFDLCFNIYYPILGLVALTAKKIKWS